MLLIIALFSTYVVYRLTTDYLKKNKPDFYVKLSKKLQIPSQILPPLIMLIFFTSNGPGLWFSMSLLVFVCLFSAVSLFVKLIKYKKNKEFLIRPFLSLVFVGVIFGLANYSIKIAEKQTFNLANAIKKECDLKGRCPAESYKTKLGSYVKYPVIYTNKEEEFTLYLYQSLDLGKMYAAGVNKPVTIVKN